ncbi:hypothetical protein lbkm_1202 [Lachnospiraceae bacterium KM106-2]|nr:hypothetical protein lbkm_1202 [Lachnospiraceae bacterium KM106-2]
MNIREAYQILGVTEEDDERTIKIKFRKKISRFHPDAVGSELPDYVAKAQRINEAYALVRKKGVPTKRKKKQKPQWQAKVNESAFVERNIYIPYFMEIEEPDAYSTITRGRYIWDPELEEFDLFLRSLNHAVIELLEGIECNYYYDDRDRNKNRFSYQIKLFNSLASQFIQPVYCLKRIASTVKVDEIGREIYAFRALLGTSGSSQAFTAMVNLKEGDLLYPSAIKNNRVLVSDSKGVSLGHLSLEEDHLYYILIPILQYSKAQVKLVVRECLINKKTRPYQVKIKIILYLRMEKEIEEIKLPNQNLVIAEILNQYESDLKY